MDTNSRARQTRASSFSLSSLFFLIAGLAVLLAVSIPALQTLKQRQIRLEVFLSTALGVGCFAGMLGAMVGLFHYRRWRGLGWGFLTGLAIGALVGPLVWSQNYGQIVTTSLGGSCLLLILAVLFRAHDRAD